MRFNTTHSQRRSSFPDSGSSRSRAGLLRTCATAGDFTGVSPADTHARGRRRVSPARGRRRVLGDAEVGGANAVVLQQFSGFALAGDLARLQDVGTVRSRQRLLGI